jgi:hypothetical protein
LDGALNIMMTDSEHRDRILAFAWHLSEFIAVLGLVGLLWSAKHLAQHSTETSRDLANKQR